ncbi:hypothetical protein EON78_03570, partial [bacterium]
MSDFATRFNSINFSVNGVTGFQNKSEIKKDIVQALSNDGKVDETEKKNILSKISDNQKNSLSNVLSSLEQDITTSIANGKVSLSNVKSTENFVNNLLKNNDNVLFIGMNTKAGGTGQENGGVSESNSIKSIARLSKIKGAEPIRVTIIKDQSSSSQANVYKGFDLKEPNGRADFLNSLNIDPNSDKGKALNSVLNKAVKTNSEAGLDEDDRDLSQDDSADELAALIENWSQGDISSRLVISGHNYNTFSSHDLKLSGVFGDSNGQLKMDWISEVAEQFPEAANQVEDLAFSSCNSGWENDMEKYQSIFPNIATIMAYTNTGSSTVYAKGQLANWEKLTEGDSGNLNRKDVAKTESQNIIQSRSTNITTWSAQGGYQIKNLDEIPKADKATKFEFIKDLTASLNLKNADGKKALFDFRGASNHRPQYNPDKTVISKLRDIEGNTFRIGRLADFVKDKERVDVFINTMIKMPEIPKDIKKQIIEAFIT